MRTRVLALELSEKLTPLWGGDEYASFWILVLYHNQPMGWVWISILPGVQIVSVEQLRQEIATQLGWNVPHIIMGQYLSPEKRTDQLLEPVSVVVCTHNRPEQLQHCLKALLSSDYPNYEIIVVDSAPSNNDTAAKVAQLPVRYVCEHQLGLSWARNRGIAEAQYNIVAFIQDGTRVDRHWLGAINQAFAEPDIAVVTGLVAPAELETTAQFLYEFDYNGAGKNLQRQVVREGTLSESDFIKGKYGSIDNAAFRRHLFTEIGLFDTALDVGTASSGASDMELLHRLIAQGYTLVYDPCVLVWHTHQRHLSLLHQHIYDKAHSLGHYLLSCWHNRSIKQVLILQLFIYEWFTKRILRNLVRPPRKLPRYIALIELAGLLTSPLAYLFGQHSAERLKLNVEETRIEKV